MNARTHTTCTVEGCDQPHDAKGLCRAHYRRWRRHGDPLTRKQASPGSGWIQRGYKYFTVSGKNTREHAVIAERALGKPLPPVAVVHHVDGNRANNRPTNLVICPDNAYHRLLHVRIDALAASGHADWRKCSYCGTYDDPLNMRGEKCGRFVHRSCSASARAAAYNKRRTNVDNIQASS